MLWLHVCDFNTTTGGGESVPSILVGAVRNSPRRRGQFWVVRRSALLLFLVDTSVFSRYLAIYTVLAAGESLVSFLSRVVYYTGGIRASRLLHQALVQSVMTSTLRYVWFFLLLPFSTDRT
jgi:hypothetical protein